MIIRNFLFFVIIFFFSINICTYAGETSDIQWPDSLDTAKDVDYLTRHEKDVILEMNKVRTNPKLYAEYLKEERGYYNGKIRDKNGYLLETNEGVKAIDECIAYLQKAKSCGILKVDENLCKAAKDHARDLSAKNTTGHRGSDKSTPGDRIERHTDRSYLSWAENISFGDGDGREMVMQLLVDDGVASRGHRTNIMNPVFTHAGLSIMPHKTYSLLCVIDYIAYYAERTSRFNR